MTLPNISPIVKVYYGKPKLPEVSRVLACLYEKDFELVAFQNVDCMPGDLIRLQASTSVPTPFFEDGSKFLFESRAICRYISETYADRGNRYLLGRDLLDRVSIEQWLKSEEQSFDPPSRALVLHLAFRPSSNKLKTMGERKNDLLEESERLSKVLDVYNHRLGESQYLAGDEFTLADLAHLPNSRYIANSHEWGHLFDERENVKRWWEDVSTRPSWRKVEDEIERSKEEEDEEEDEEEMTEETEDNFIGITRCANRKMSLKAGIFQPIEASAKLPVKPKSTFTVSKNVAAPRGSVQVTLPDKKGFSVSVPEQKVTQVETTRIQPHTKQQVADAKVTMESTIPTARIDKASTEATRIQPQSKQPVADAKVTMEESTIPTARIDKANTEATRVISQSTKPVTDAKVTIEGSDVLPTGTQMPSTARIDKTKIEQTRAIPQSTKPVTDAKVKVEKTSTPRTSTEVLPTHETTPESAKVTNKYAAYPTDETSISKSRGFLSREAPISTSKTEQPTKPSMEGTTESPTEKTTKKPLTRDQGQTLSPPSATEVTPTHETTTESAKEPEKYIAYQADETRRSDSRGLRFTQVPVPTSEAVEPIKQSLEGPQSPPTEKTTTKLPTKNQGQISTTESKHGQAAEELTNKEDETKINTEAYISVKHKEWEDQWQKPEKYGEEKHTKGIPAEKSQPPKFENTTPTTRSASPTTSSETARQEPVPYKSTDIPAKEPFESSTSIKPKDTTPPATQANSIPAATQETAVTKTTGASSAPSASTRGLTQSTSITQNGITDKTSNAPAPKPPKQERSTTPTPATTTTSQTAKQEPTTDKSITPPAKGASRSTLPISQKERSLPTTTTKTQDTALEVMREQTTIPAATQALPLSSTNETTNGIANETNNVPTQSPKTVQTKPMTDKPNNASAIETSKPTVPATQEETSRVTTTKEPKEKVPLGTETPFPVSTQQSSSETTRKDQAPSATKQRPSAGETTAEATGKDQAPLATKQTPPTDETVAGYAEVSQPKTASSGATSGIDLAKSSQTDIQMKKSEEKQALPSETTFEVTTSSPNNQKTVELSQEEKSSSLKEIAPASVGSTTELDATQEETSRGTTTKEPKEKVPMGTETPFSVSTQQSSTETTGKDQAPPATKQRPSAGETTAETTGKDQAPLATKQTPPTDETVAGYAEVSQPKTASSGTTSSIDLAKSSQTDTQMKKSEEKQALPSGTTFEATTSASNNQKTVELSQEEKSSSLKEVAPASVGSTTELDATQEETSRGTTTKEPKEKVPMGTETPFSVSTQQSSTETTGKDQAPPATKQRPSAGETTAETTGKDQAPLATKQTPPTDETVAGYADVSQPKTASSGTTSSIDLAKSSQTDTQMKKSEEKQALPSGTTFEATTSASNNQKTVELSQEEKSSSLKEIAPASTGSTTEPDTTPKQKEALSRTKTEPEKLDTDKPHKTTSQPNKTNDNENLSPVDEAIMEKTKTIAPSIQTPPRDMSTKGVPSVETTSSEKVPQQPASLEEATKDQASQGDDLSQDEKSSSAIETAPTSDGRSEAPDSTPKQKDTQNETKTEPDQLDTKTQDAALEVMTEQTTIPAAKQALPLSSANETTDRIANETNNVLAQSPKTAQVKPMIDKPNNASAIETSKPTVPATQEETSRGTTTKETKEKVPLGTETPFPVSTQQSSSETTGKDQAPLTTKQRPSTGETTAKTTGKDQASLATKQTPPTDETVAGYAEVSQPKTASSGTTSGIDLAKSSQIDTQISTMESKHGQAAEELSNKEDETKINAEAYLSAKHKEWEDQWQNPEKYVEEKHAKGIPAEKPQPPKFENTTPTTRSASPTTSSETTRQELVPYKSTDIPAKEPFESSTSTKQKDTTPPATQANSIPAVTQDTVVTKTTGASSAPSANTQELPQSTSRTQNEITDKTSNAPAPKPPKQERSTTPTLATTTTSQTAKQEPTTDKSITPPAKQASRSTLPISQEERSLPTTTTKTQDTALEVMKEQTTIPAATQALPLSSTNETTDGIANETNNVPTQSPKTVQTKPMTDKPNNASAIETSKPTVPATQEETSRGTTTKEPKEKVPMGTETPFPVSTQQSSSETTGKDQAPPAIKQRPSAGETTAETNRKDQAPLATKETPPTDETVAGYEEVFQPKTASSGTTSSIDLAKSSQTDTQMKKSEEKQALPSGTTSEATTSASNNQKTVEFSQEENSSSLKEIAPASVGSTTEPDATQKETSRGTTTKEPKEKVPMGTEIPFPVSPQQSSSETIGKDQAPPATKQRPSTDETTTKTTGKDQAPLATKKTPPTDETVAGYDDVSQPNTASSGTTSSIDLAKSSQTDTQMKKSEEKQALPSGTTFEATTSSPNNQKTVELSQEEKSSSLKEIAPASAGSTTKPDTTPKQKEALSRTKTEPEKLDTDKPNKTTSQPNKTNDNENLSPVYEAIMEKTKNIAPSIQTPPRDMSTKGVPSAETTSSEKVPQQPASLEEATKDQASKGGDLSQDEKSSSAIETAPTSDGRSEAPDLTPKQKDTQNETKTEPDQLGTKTQDATLEVMREQTTIPAARQSLPLSSTNETTDGIANETNNVPTQSPNTAQAKPMIDKPNKASAIETSKPIVLTTQEETSRGTTTKESKEKVPMGTETPFPVSIQQSSSETTGKDQGPLATKQTPPTDETVAGYAEVSQPKTISSDTTSGIDLAKSSQTDTQMKKLEEKQALPSGTTFEATTSSPNNQKTVELSQEEKSSSLKEIAPASAGSTTEPDTTAKQKEALSKTKTEPEKLDTDKPHKTTSQPNRTNDNENLSPVDEAIMEKTKNIAPSIQTPPRDMSTKGVPSAEITSFEKVPQQPASLEEATKDQASKGGDLSQDEKSSSAIETAPTFDGRSEAPDLTPKQKDTQNETKTEPDQLSTNKPSQITSQPSKANDANPTNEALSDMNQKMASPKDNEVNSSNVSSPEPRIEQNNKPDSTNNPGPANKE